MKSSRLLQVAMAIVMCYVMFTPAAQAQYRGSLRGTVSDPQGAVVPDATVTLVNKDTNNTMVAISDDNGIYTFNALPPAPYRLTVDHPGFKKQVLENVKIIPEQLNSLNLQLVVGEVDQTVTVSSTTEALDTETATISGTISSNQIQHMPSFNRDVFQLAQLTPGVFGDASQQGGGGPTVCLEPKDRAGPVEVRAEFFRRRTVRRLTRPVASIRPTASRLTESARSARCGEARR